MGIIIGMLLVLIIYNVTKSKPVVPVHCKVHKWEQLENSMKCKECNFVAGSL